MSSGGSFRLVKWYADCVSDRGDLFIGYWATLAWRGLQVTYASSITAPYNEPTVSQSTLRPGNAPQLDGVRLQWHCPSLGIAGRWHGLDAPLQRILLDDPNGQVRWYCHLPRAHAEIRLGSGGILAGLGYAESTELTIEPWRLPMRELHWGRFLGELDAVVWIDWRGDHPQQLGWHQGQDNPPTRVCERGIEWNTTQAALTLEPTRTVRQGQLGPTVLSSVPLLWRLLPPAILATHEQKWLSRGILSSPQQAPRHGWAIHEVVRFGPESP